MRFSDMSVFIKPIVPALKGIKTRKSTVSSADLFALLSWPRFEGVRDIYCEKDLYWIVCLHHMHSPAPKGFGIGLNRFEEGCKDYLHNDSR